MFWVDGTAEELELEEELEQELEELEEVFEEALDDEFVEDTGSTHTLVIVKLRAGNLMFQTIGLPLFTGWVIAFLSSKYFR